jgi:division/cell wall cluster transcriptional repressor MraZ
MSPAETPTAPPASPVLPPILVGQFTPKLDDKRRVQVAGEWRHGPLAQSTKFLLVLERRDGADATYLKVLTEHGAAKLYQKLAAMDELDPEADALRRSLAADAAFVELDAAGRLMLPERQARAIGVAAGDPLLVVGGWGHFEIWPRERGEAALRSDRPVAQAKRLSLIRHG